MANETLLIVDDNAEMLHRLGQSMLEPLGYRVITALDGKAGLQAAIESKPDLILLDMCMPRMTGLEMLAALRQTDCASPVVFMATYESEAVAVEAFRMGVRDYVSKPFTLEKVLQAVDRALREVRLEREREALNRGLLTAEAVRTTVVTLSHYLNNHIMAVSGVLTLLEERLEEDSAGTEALAVVREGRVSAKRLQAVLHVLQRATEIRLIPYSESTPMIDIVAALEGELEGPTSHPGPHSQLPLLG